MKYFKILFTLFIFSFIIAGCGPKSVTTGPEELSTESKSWIPYTGNEQLTFYQDTSSMRFNGQGKDSYFENVRYMTDQSGFFTYQEDYYADMERQELIFISNQTEYFLSFFLEKNKGETGNWDILKVKISDGIYYMNEIKIVIYESDKYDKGETFRYKASISLNGNTYNDVYYWTQERRPFELYYSKDLGIIGYKVSTNELWTINPPAK